MTAKTYSAGTIFLQVVPVFKDAMREITREAKDLNKALGDEMEKGGTDAGKRASKAMGKELQAGGADAGEAYAGEFRRQLSDGIAKMSRELKPIKINVERNELRKDFAEIKAEVDALGKAKIGVDLDAATALARLATVQASLRTLQASAKNIEVKTNVDEATKGVDRLIARIEKAKPVIEVEVKAERALGAFERKWKSAIKNAAGALGDQIDPEIQKIKRRLDTLSDVEVGVDISDEEAYSELLRLESALARLTSDKRSIGLDLNIMAALGELEALAVAIDKTERDEVEIKVELRGVARAMAGLRALESRAKASANDGIASANAFRALSFVILGLATILPAVIPLIAALGGALLALMPILAGVGAGVGVMILGFSGIGDAVSALGDVQKNAGKEAEQSAKSMRGAARSVADAQRSLARARQDAARSSADAARSVADAERNAAQQVEAALERQRDAIRNLAEAQRDARDAERDLMQARREARDDLRDLGDDLTANQLAEDQGVLDLFDATTTYNTTNADGAATNYEKEQARINLESAQLRLKNIREERIELKKQRKEGIAGTDRVESAQDALTAALERQRDAQRAVGEAAEEVNEARIDGARAVQDALRQQARTEADNARAIGDAQRNLRRAQQDYRDALKQTGTEGSASMEKLEEAMGKLGPAGQKFARFLFGLRGQFRELRDAAQAGMLPGVQESIETILNRYGPGLKTFVGDMGEVLGGLFRRFGKMLSTPVFEDFFAMMAKQGPKFMKEFGETFQNWLAIFARVLTIAAPWADKFSGALLALSERALAFVESTKGTKKFEQFMTFVEQVGPKVWEFFTDLWDALVNIGEALAPLGVLVLEAFGAFLEFIADMDPKLLGAIATGILVLVIAFQALMLVQAAASAGVTLFLAFAAGGVLAATLAVVGIVLLIAGVFIILYTQSETARKIMNATFRGIGKAAMWLWEKAIKPAFEFIWDLLVLVFKGIAWYWKNIVWPVLKALGATAKWLWEKVLRPVFGFIWEAWKFMAKMIRGFYLNVIWPVLDLLITAIGKLLWKGVIKPVLGLIIALWGEMSAEFMYGWKTWIKPAFDSMMNGLNSLRDKFSGVVERIGEIWGGLKQALAGPVRFLIDTVINDGIIGSFNKLAKFVGSKEIPDVPMPDFARQGTYSSAAGAGGSGAGQGNGQMGFANGGVLPGYTPGVDVHRFTSPTGGRLNLSGGEAIMRPEWTNAMGPAYVEKMNALARQKGVNGVRKAMGFAKGGIVWPTDFRSLSEDYPGHTGVDISIPGTADYGRPVFASAAGMARASWAGEGSYGNLVRIDHGGYETLYAHLAAPGYSGPVKAGQQIGNVGSTGNSTGPHLHFEVRPGSTRAAALAYLGGASTPTGGGDGFLGGLAKWAKGAVSKPVSWITDRVEGSLDKLGSSPFGNMLVGFGKKIIGGVADFITGGGPGAKGDTDGGGAGSGPEASFALGGTFGSTKLRNNGTMMYDNGGMLPPGLTSVVNLTGKPEPVFTSDQFSSMRGGGGEGGGLHYEPHFEGSDLTAADVMDDFMFTYRRLGNRGKYAGSET